MFKIDNTGSPKKETKGPRTLQELLQLPQQNVILVDMRGEGISAHKEYNDWHIMGSVTFPHGWMNR